MAGVSVTSSFTKLLPRCRLVGLGLAVKQPEAPTRNRYTSEVSRLEVGLAFLALKSSSGAYFLAKNNL